MELYIYAVIASQCAHWRGNPLRTRRKPNEIQAKTFGDCHVGLRPPRNDMFLRLPKRQFAFNSTDQENGNVSHTYSYTLKPAETPIYPTCDYQKTFFDKIKKKFCSRNPTKYLKINEIVSNFVFHKY